MIASRTLGHPLVVAAIALLVINDHLLKAAYPGLVTGKLSDVAGLMFFPVLVAAALEQLGFRRGAKTVVIATIATGVGFAAIKLSLLAGELFRVGLATLQWPFHALSAVIGGDAVPGIGRVSLVADPTDLIALAALAVPLWMVRAAGITSNTRLRRSPVPS